MSKNKWALSCGIALIIGLAVFNSPYLRSRSGEAEHQVTAPPFELKDFQGHAHTLAEFKGSWVVLHFWASWCPPCLEETPLWIQLAQDTQSLGLRWVAVSQDKSWLEARKIMGGDNAPAGAVVSLLDASGKVSDLYGTYQLPETYLIDPKSRIAFKWVGRQDWSAPEMRSFLEGKIRK